MTQIGEKLGTTHPHPQAHTHIDTKQSQMCQNESRTESILQLNACVFLQCVH